MWYFPKSLFIAETHALLGKLSDAIPFYEEAQSAMETALTDAPDDPRRHVAMSSVLVGLGRPVEALTHSLRATELIPTSKDAIAGPVFESFHAITHARVGDLDTAIRKIDQLLSMPSFLAAGQLRVSPAYDSLRGHPEFDRLLSSPEKVF
jgi:tetratricopeptide (TPR) repeat protein